MRLFVLVGLGIIAIVAAGVIAFSNRGEIDRTADALDEPGPSVVAPAAIVDVPEEFYRQPVKVGGEVTALGPDGTFALTGPERSVLVLPEVETDGIATGDRVEVFGVVNYLDRLRGGPPVVGDAPSRDGDPYVAANRIVEQQQ